MVDFKSMNEEELAAFVANGKAELANKQAESRKGVISQIHELAKSIGAKVDISFSSDAPANRRGGKVAVKYRDPANPSNQWTGRGQAPRWLQAYFQAGRTREEFAV